MNVDWSGVFPAATTQFHSDFSLDIEGTLKCLEPLLEGGIHGLVMLGTVGENCSLTPEEKLTVLREAVKFVDGRVPVLTGVAEYTTQGACDFAVAAKGCGVDGLMVLPAMVYVGDFAEQSAHFRSVAAATDLPIMIYNNPVSYRVDVSPEQFVELMDVPTIVAIKESSEDPRRITDLINLCGDRYILFCGVDDVFLESRLLGARGWVSGLVDAFPSENRLIWDLAEAGRWDEAVEVYRWYRPLLVLDTKPKLVQYIKMAMAEVGIGTETCRPPRLRVEGDEREEVMGIIRTAIANRPEWTDKQQASA